MTCSKTPAPSIPSKSFRRLEEKEDKVTMIYVKIDKNADVDDVTERIEEKYG